MENDIYKSPEADLSVESTETFVLAKRLSRLGAAIVDGIIMAFLTLPLMYITGGFDVLTTGAEPSFIYTTVISIFGLIMFIVINGRFLLRDGQTIGKKLCLIRIETESGAIPDVKVYSKRYGFQWLIQFVPVIGGVLSLINILFIFSSSKKCLHDHVAKTRVVAL